MQELDSALFELINAGATAPAWSIHFARFASDLLPTLLAAAILCGAMFDRRLRYACFTALVSVLVVWVLVNVFRSVMPFQRPAFYGLGIQWAPQGARPGFPSLHAAGTFAAAFSLWCLPRRAPMRAALAVAAVVAWSRVFLGLHFPLDVVVGAMLAAVVAIAVERGVSRPLNLALRAWMRPRLRARRARAG
ncbi:undecaprenyl-diphosphatase [Variovorax sp. TBS-050B]|jgi:undecaprenyl-diphosphatase|uniref:phosphatase PAP2 family protein n=1 Tax=Variovorax sp. TBS-050B TaxID=2940551 RepID=UPI0024758DEA|nr:phosphatase PAP2 family protein [Variovorax sp. TBS-050B]MDH6593948.1 undecaprenyl-diphosphatase [Variovorax sp. TBS-050B]